MIWWRSSRRWIVLRFSVFSWLNPARYIERGEKWANFDLYGWSAEDYEWVSDGPSVFADRASPPGETVASGRGDCDDYALVAASWAASVGESGVGLAICGHTRFGVPRLTHMVAVDDRRVYSSGHIYETSLEEYVAASDDYTWAVPRYL